MMRADVGRRELVARFGAAGRGLRAGAVVATLFMVSLVPVLAVPGAEAAGQPQCGKPNLLGGEVAVWQFDADDFDASLGATIDATPNRIEARLGFEPVADAYDPQPVAGRFCGGYDFNGAARLGIVGAPEPLYTLQKVSVMGWVRFHSLQGSQVLLSNAACHTTSTGYGLHALDGHMVASLTNGGVCDVSQYQSLRPMPLETWTHIAFTFDGSKVRLFVNGELDAEYPRTAPMFNPQFPTVIGMDFGNDARANAVFDEVRVYNRALSAAEIQKVMNNPYGGRAVIAPVPPAECVDGRATVALDGSGSFDPEGDPLTFQWAAPGVNFGDPASPRTTGSFPLGATQLTLTVSDGVTSDTATALVRVIDSFPPVTSAEYVGTPGSVGWWTSAVRATLTARDQCGVARTLLAIDGGAFQAGTDATLVEDGVRTVSYYSVDVAGNQEEAKSDRILIDKTPPRVQLTDPVAGHAYLKDRMLPRDGLPLTLLVGNKTLRAEADDAMSGMDRVEFWVDGRVRATDTAAPYEFRWEAGKEGLGGHTLAVRAVDVAGNQNWTSVLEVHTVPTTPEGAHATAVRLCESALSPGLCVALPSPDAPIAICRAFFTAELCEQARIQEPEDPGDPSVQPPSPRALCALVASAEACAAVPERVPDATEVVPPLPPLPPLPSASELCGRLLSPQVCSLLPGSVAPPPLPPVEGLVPGCSQVASPQVCDLLPAPGSSPALPATPSPAALCILALSPQACAVLPAASTAVPPAVAEDSGPVATGRGAVR